MVEEIYSGNGARAVAERLGVSEATVFVLAELANVETWAWIIQTAERIDASDYLELRNAAGCLGLCLEKWMFHNEHSQGLV